VVTSGLAIVTGLVMVNLVRPGLGGVVNQQATEAPEVSGDLGAVLFGQVETMIPTNPVGALAEGNFLSIICFSLAFAIFAIIVGGRTLQLLRDFFNAAFDVMMAMTMAIIKLAPLGVTFLMLYVTATQGPAVFQSLFWYMLTVVCALGFHAVVVLPLIVKFVTRRNPWKFAQAMSPALLTAFSSASSNGTLPLTLASVEERAGVSNRVSSFVLPLGATINMDGTALYEAVAVLFIAQLYHGYNLPLTQQIIVAVTALLASVGAAGIPHAGLVMMVIILQAVGLPVEMQGVILAVDRVLDMCRTSVNVWSDSCGCAVVARFESGSGDHAATEPELPLEDQP
jgi:proton glutamate symport protein